jgi:hypothetical protein
MKPFILGAFLIFSVTTVVAAPMSDGDIKRAIIQQSLAAYPGPCPCPYNHARNGSSCGRRSAYSRPGGYSPVCYDADVTPDMMRRYREDHGG